MAPSTDVLHHIRLLVYLWNAVGFSACAWLLFREFTGGARIWGGVRTALLVLDMAVTYAMNVWVSLMPPITDFHWAIHDALDLAVPALIAHVFFHAERGNLRRLAWWRFGLIATYAACGAGLAFTVLAPFWVPGWHGLRRWSFPSFCAILGVTAAMTALLVWQTRHSGVPEAKRKLAGWVVAGFVLVGAVHLVNLACDPLWLSAFESLVPGSLLFLLAYYVQPLTFDVLIKGVSFAYFVLVAVYLSWWVFPAIPFLGGRNAFPWFIVCVWPAVAAVPWLRARWLRWIDATLFKRRFTPAEARTRFLAGLEGAITEEQLARSAECALGEVFGSGVRICLPAAPPAGGPGMDALIRVGGEVCGSIQVASRGHIPQFMSADIALLNSLASEFSILLDNQRLREKKIEQERREKDLQILATRAELKALRAQINPHFLFNALGAIAGLVSRDASRARETVEQLAEVFRYTLCRSENEWVRLAEEMDFVAAYLDVERSRFGPRLEIEIAVEEAARQLWVPAMVMQVLVENAIKHGVSAVRGVGIVNIRGECRGERLSLEVRDNGSGFRPKARAPAAGGQGFGLRNIEDRLHLYFGDRGWLRIGREESMTVVAIEFPAQRAPAVSVGVRP